METLTGGWILCEIYQLLDICAPHLLYQQQHISKKIKLQNLQILTFVKNCAKAHWKVKERRILMLFSLILNKIFLIIWKGVKLF